MNFYYFVLFKLILFGFLDLSTCDLIMNLFVKQFACELRSLLIDDKNNFQLYFNKQDLVLKIDIQANELIDNGSKLKFLSNDDHFSACLLNKEKDNHFYFIIHQNRIIKLGKNFLFDDNYR